ncbi:MAG: pilus assembly protein PilM [Patescibacteria group bacterium]
MHFGAKTAVGISVADHIIEIVELTGGPKPSIAARNRIMLDAGVVVGGAIHDEKKLASVFAKLFADAKPVPVSTRHIVFGIPERATYFHIFEAQKISAEHIANAVARNIPLPAEDVVWSHRVFPQTKDASRVVIAAASRKLVESWQNFLISQGIVVDIFDIEVFAIFRNLFREFPKEPVLVVDMGGETTTISIFDSAGLAYTRSTHIAGEYLTREIAGALKITRDEAEEKKNAIGLGDREHPIFFALIKGLEIVVKEMRAASEYFARTRNMRVSQIVLAGGSSRMPGLAVYMEANFDMPIVVASPTSDVEAVGFALRGLEARWDATDPKLTLEQTRESWYTHVSKPALHWSLPQGHAGPVRLTWLLLAAFCISLIFLAALIYVRYGA